MRQIPLLALTVLRSVRATEATDREQAKRIRWDDEQQHLVIEVWVGDAQPLRGELRP